MISKSWFAINSDNSPLRNREITTVMLSMDHLLCYVVLRYRQATSSVTIQHSF